MDIQSELRIHRSHLPTAVRQEVPQTLREIRAAIDDFLIVARDLTERLNEQNVERTWESSGLAWALLLPSRRDVLQTDRAIVERFREAVEGLLRFLEDEVSQRRDAFKRLGKDLERRKSLLDALLAPNGERRIRELLASDRQAADLG